MSTPLKNLTPAVMERIAAEQIAMRPRWYFVVGSVATMLGLTLAFLSSAFLLSIWHLSLRVGGRGAEWRLDQLTSLFYWWVPALALLALGVGVWLLRRYDFSFRLHFGYVASGFLLAVLFASSLFVLSGAPEILTQRGPLRELVKPWQTESVDDTRPPRPYGSR